MKLKKIDRFVTFSEVFRGRLVGVWVGGWCGRIENKIISAFNLGEIEVEVELKLSYVNGYSYHTFSVREGLKKNPTNLGFWLNLRWVGARKGSRCPTPLKRFSFIPLN